MAEQVAGIAYERAGEGKPLLLIHGLGATRAIWQPQMELLVAERDVIAIDLPGFGDSEPLAEDQPAGAAALANRVASFCGELGIERPHVAGNSLGGWVALELAKHNRASSLCLISPAGLWRRPLGPRSVNTRGVASKLKPLLFGLARSEAMRARMLRTVVGRPENVPPEAAVELIRSWIEAPGYESANLAMREGIFEGVERVRVPTAIACGELDRLVAPPKPDRRPPGSRFVVLEGCGHTPNWDDPELVAELLLKSSRSAEERQLAA